MHSASRDLVLAHLLSLLGASRELFHALCLPRPRTRPSTQPPRYLPRPLSCTLSPTTSYSPIYLASSVPPTTSFMHSASHALVLIHIRRVHACHPSYPGLEFHLTAFGLANSCTGAQDNAGTISNTHATMTPRSENPLHNTEARETPEGPSAHGRGCASLECLSNSAE